MGQIDYAKIERFRSLNMDLKRAAAWSNLDENRAYAWDNVFKFIQKFMDPLDGAYRALSNEEKREVGDIMA